MLLQNIKEFGKRLFSGEQSNLVKIFSTLSLIWMMIVGYLVWWNGISSPGFDKILNGMNGFGLDLCQLLLHFYSI